MPQITTVLFDLDKTLVYPPDEPTERLDEAFATAGVAPFFTVEDFERVMPEVDGNTALDLRLKCFKQIAAENGVPAADAEAVARAFEMPDGPEFVPVGGASEVVTTLRARGYDVGMVTNGAEAKQRKKLRVLGLEDAFGTTVFGSPERGLKPDPAPLRLALDELGAAPQQTVKIGDSHAVDVEPANDLGMTSVWFPPDIKDYQPSDEADITIETLRRLLDEPWRET